MSPGHRCLHSYRLSQHAQVKRYALYCIVLYCIVLYCIVRYGTVRYGTVRYGTVRYGTVRYCTVLYCTVLYCTVLYCTVLYKVYHHVWSCHQNMSNCMVEIQRHLAESGSISLLTSTCIHRLHCSFACQQNNQNCDVNKYRPNYLQSSFFLTLHLRVSFSHNKC